MMPSQHTLSQLFDYNAKTGVLTWRERPPRMFVSSQSCASWNAKHAGKEARGTNLKGYRRIRIDGFQHLAHRIVWVLVHGVEPVGEIDHINGVRSDNRLANLRLVDKKANQRNAGVRVDNTSGVTGVYWYPKYRCWLAKLANKHVGYFDTKEKAIAARKEAQRRANYHPNHANRPSMTALARHA